MLSFKSFVFTALLAGSQAENLRSVMTPRGLSQELIAGFEPSSSVEDHNAIDRDQKAMEVQLGDKSNASFENAKAIYEQGGNSKTFAVLTIPGGLTVSVGKGDEVFGTNEAGLPIQGKVYEAASSSETTLKVQYLTGDSQASYSDCQVGGLVETNTVGCFTAANGTLTVAGVANVAYTYDIAENNDNGRTLQGFSTSAQKKMRVNGNGAFYDDFQKFLDYYGDSDYSDKFALAALAGNSLSIGGKTFDFSSYDFEARAEVVKKTTAYMGTAMYVIRELEDALDDCVASDSTRNDDAVKALDEAVAFYTGSLEGSAGGSGSGVQFYALANKRCQNLNTCGTSGDANTGNSKVNHDIFKEFDRMQQNLNTVSCADARKNKEDIAKKLFVPLVQGTIRYAHIQENQPDSGTKAESEGAVFAAAVLPVVHACNTADATTIYQNMRPESGLTADFNAVKNAFERNYACMGITCADVGGMWDKGNDRYFDGAGPCGGAGGSDDGVNVGLAVGLSIGGVALLGLILMFVKRRNASAVEFKSDDNNQI